MKNNDLSRKIKELRTRKGFSQEELADMAQINLRTVQRIESGETEPRGDTLRRLGQALNVTSDELIDWAEQEDNRFLVLFNLSALSFIAFPFLGVIIPFAMWFLKKDKIKNLNTMGRELLNFQITWCICLFILYALLIIGGIFHIIFLPGDLTMMVMVLLLYVLNIIFITVNAVRCNKNKTMFYKPAFKFLR